MCEKCIFHLCTLDAFLGKAIVYSFRESKFQLAFSAKQNKYFASSTFENSFETKMKFSSLLCLDPILRKLNNS